MLKNPSHLTAFFVDLFIVNLSMGLVSLGWMDCGRSSLDFSKSSNKIIPCDYHKNHIVEDIKQLDGKRWKIKKYEPENIIYTQ